MIRPARKSMRSKYVRQPTSMPKGPGVVLGRMPTTALRTLSRVIGARKCACIATEKGVKSAKKSDDRGKLAAGRLNKVQK